MAEAIGVDDFVRTAEAHGNDLEGSTDLACVIVGLAELSARGGALLEQRNWGDLAREVNLHNRAYADLVEHLSGVRPAGLDLVVLQGRLVQPLWQDTTTAEPVIQLTKSVPKLDETLIQLVGNDAGSADAVKALRAAADRLSHAADIFAPDYDPNAKLDPDLERLLHRMSQPPEEPTDGPTGAPTL